MDRCAACQYLILDGSQVVKITQGHVFNDGEFEALDTNIFHQDCIKHVLVR